MQEQNQYNITPEQGWSRMNSILDREMPVERKSRRMIVFWWSLASLVLLGLAGLFLLRSEMHSSRTNTLTPDQQVAPLPVQPNNELQKEEETNTINNDFTQNTTSESTYGSNTMRSNSATTIPNETVHTADLKSNNQKAVAEGKIKLKTDVESMAVNQSGETIATMHSALPEEEAYAMVIQGGNVNANDDKLSARAFINVGIAEPLPSLDMAYFTIPENELSPVHVSKFSKSNSPTHAIRPCVEANVLSGFQGGTGYYAGAGADVELGSRLSLSGSLGFRSFHPGGGLFGANKAKVPSADVNTGLVKSDTIFDGYYVPGESINNATYAELDPVIESLQQWQAQLGADWKISRRFSVEGGFGLAFHTRANSEYPIVPFSYSFNPTYTRFSNSLDGYDVIRNTMTSVYAGMAYHLGKHVALELHCLHTFQPYLNTPQSTGSYVPAKQRDDFIRGITMGMKYSFL